LYTSDLRSIIKRWHVRLQVHSVVVVVVVVVVVHSGQDVELATYIDVVGFLG